MFFVDAPQWKVNKSHIVLLVDKLKDKLGYLEEDLDLSPKQRRQYEKDNIIYEEAIYEDESYTVSSQPITIYHKKIANASVEIGFESEMYEMSANGVAVLMYDEDGDIKKALGGMLVRSKELGLYFGAKYGDYRIIDECLEKFAACETVKDLKTCKKALSKYNAADMVERSQMMAP